LKSPQIVAKAFEMNDLETQFPVDKLRVIQAWIEAACGKISVSTVCAQGRGLGTVEIWDESP
jgi:hypothetical protein